MKIWSRVGVGKVKVAVRVTKGKYNKITMYNKYINKLASTSSLRNRIYILIKVTVIDIDTLKIIYDILNLVVIYNTFGKSRIQ